MMWIAWLAERLGRFVNTGDPLTSEKPADVCPVFLTRRMSPGTPARKSGHDGVSYKMRRRTSISFIPTRYKMVVMYERKTVNHNRATPVA